MLLKQAHCLSRVCPLSHHQPGLTVHCVLTLLEKAYSEFLRTCITTIPLLLNRNQGPQVPLQSCENTKLSLLVYLIPFFYPCFLERRCRQSCWNRGISHLCSPNNLHINTPNNPFSTFLGKLRHCAPTQSVKVEIHCILYFTLHHVF